MVLWHNGGLSSKNQVSRVAFFPENRVRRGKIKKTRPLLICNIPPIVYQKWSYFFDFWPLSLRNGNKGQNQGQCPGAFVCRLWSHFFCQQSGFWEGLPPE